MHKPDIDKLKHELTYEQWAKWEQFYAQDQWGELRHDLRMLAAVLKIHNPHSEVSMIGPNYFGEPDDVDDNVRYEQLQAEIAAIGPEQIQEALKRGREKHLAEKAKRG